MIITCPECDTKYRYDERRFEGAASKRVKCTSCGFTFQAINPDHSPPIAARPTKTTGPQAPKASAGADFQSPVVDVSDFDDTEDAAPDFGVGDADVDDAVLDFGIGDADDAAPDFGIGEVDADDAAPDGGIGEADADDTASKYEIGEAGFEPADADAGIEQVEGNPDPAKAETSAPEPTPPSPEPDPSGGEPIQPLPTDPRYSLAVIAGGQAGSVFQIHKPRIFLGRGSAMDIQLRDSEVSRRHALLEIRDPEVTLTDLDATNGTWVEGTQITSTKLEHPDEFTLGSTTLMLIVTPLGGGH